MSRKKSELEIELDEYLRIWQDSLAIYSKKASEICRQLAFAGIAVCWLFAIIPNSESSFGPAGQTTIHLPSTAATSIFLFVVYMGIDALHAIVPAFYYWKKESQYFQNYDTLLEKINTIGKSEFRQRQHKLQSRIAGFFFISKFLFFLAAMLSLIIAAANQINLL